jgi:hypothetical protein
LRECGAATERGQSSYGKASARGNPQQRSSIDCRIKGRWATFTHASISCLIAKPAVSIRHAAND